MADRTTPTLADIRARHWDCRICGSENLAIREDCVDCGNHTRPAMTDAEHVPVERPTGAPIDAVRARHAYVVDNFDEQYWGAADRDRAALLAMVDERDAEVAALRAALATAEADVECQRAKLRAYAEGPEFAARFTACMVKCIDEEEAARVLAWEWCIIAERWQRVAESLVAEKRDGNSDIIGEYWLIRQQRKDIFRHYQCVPYEMSGTIEPVWGNRWHAAKYTKLQAEIAARFLRAGGHKGVRVVHVSARAKQ